MSLSNQGKQERREAALWLRCESCSHRVWIERELYAIDKYGDVLCHDCHVRAVLLLARAGVIWEGVTLGYDLSDVFRVGGAS